MNLIIIGCHLLSLLPTMLVLLRLVSSVNFDFIGLRKSNGDIVVFVDNGDA